MISIEEVKEALRGPIGSVSTPFNKDNTIDYKGLKNCVDYLVESKSGTVLLTVGDSLYTILTEAEIAEVTKVVVEQTAGRAMVVAACGIWPTCQAVEFAKYCRQIGTDVLMTLPPDWICASSAQNLIKHYESVAKEMPVMLVTALGSRAIPEETIKVLLDKKNSGIVAIKDDTFGVYAKRIASLVDGRWPFLCGGCMFNYLDVMHYGSDGYLSLFMAYKNNIDHEFWEAVKSRNFKKATSIINKYEFPLAFDLPKQFGTDSDALIHAALEIFGIAQRWRREPYYSLNEEQMELLEDFYKKNSLL
ncbi:MAG: dihydrodipicolinate synthase family protein [Actinobacteria bacterium]|nr:dihydrodipicolinate synthase family protein [Actinomycetota bacterium]